MATKLFKRKQNTFQVSVGEEGAVVVYTQNGYAKAKIFVHSTEQSDTEKLRELLNKDRDALVYIYIDTLDQSYVQRSIPGVSAMGVGKMAQRRLEKEVPKEHLKACVQIGRANVGRRDWVYTFISAGMEPPVSTWIEFFTVFHNVIAGIYFLPIELYAIVTRLKSIAQKENQFQQKEKKGGFAKFLAALKPAALSNEGRWEVYLSQNKTGGFRQVAYQDGRIVFSRLLNNINDPAPEVVAGNIEQEIANSIEYMSRLSLGSEQEVDVYLILSSDILRYLRKEKVKATNLFTYTPYELGVKIKVPESGTDKDKFADPTILTALSKVNKKFITLHTAVTGKVYNATLIINYIGFFFVFLIPFFLIMTLYLVNDILDLKSSIAQVQNQSLNFQSQLNEQKKKLTNTEIQIKEELKVEHVIEVVDLYKFFNAAGADPIVVIQKLSSIIPAYARAKVIRWSYDEPVMFGFKVGAQTAKTSIMGQKREYTISSDFEIVMKRFGSSYEELEKKYTGFTKDVRNTFSDFELGISDLPQSFSFQDANNPISVTVKLQYPPKKSGAGSTGGQIPPPVGIVPPSMQPPSMMAPATNPPGDL